MGEEELKDYTLTFDGKEVKWVDTVELNKDDIIDIDSSDEINISDLNNISLEVEGMEIPEWLMYWMKLREHFIDKEDK